MTGAGLGAWQITNNIVRRQNHETFCINQPHCQESNNLLGRSLESSGVNRSLTENRSVSSYAGMDTDSGWILPGTKLFTNAKDAINAAKIVKLQLMILM